MFKKMKILRKYFALFFILCNLPVSAGVDNAWTI